MLSVINMSRTHELVRQLGGNQLIKTEDILHVRGWDHVWPGDFTNETRALVKQVYARDFDLLCRHFGYCDHDENNE